ncbi:MAG: LytTR family DNA-binding domain-containing protein [Clostridiales bacterium]|nr:LytTR family DNA-binding domain-containing protein [Clostridiales bacterium]
MHFAIVEDLDADRARLTDLIDRDCADHDETAEFSLYTNAADFLADFRRGFCSAVFLDIMLGGGMNGIETAWKVRAQDEYLPVIFTTTEKGYALDSYGIHALDFLVKPVQPEALAWCLGRLRSEAAAPEYLAVRGKNAEGRMASPHCVLLNDLTDTEAVSRGCVLHTVKGDVFTDQKHMELMNLLPKTGRFYEYARGMSVNFSHVVSISARGDILLKDGRQLFCSRRKTKETIEAFRQFQFAQLRTKGV